MKLEKMEFGGIKGRCLSDMVVQIFNEFQEQINKFSNSTYNPLDVSNKASAYTPVHLRYLLTRTYLCTCYVCYCTYVCINL